MIYYACFIAGVFCAVIILSIFRSGRIADEMALIEANENVRRKLRVAHKRIKSLEAERDSARAPLSNAHYRKRYVDVARGERI